MAVEVAAAKRLGYKDGMRNLQRQVVVELVGCVEMCFWDLAYWLWKFLVFALPDKSFPQPTHMRKLELAISLPIMLRISSAAD